MSRGTKNIENIDELYQKLVENQQEINDAIEKCNKVPLAFDEIIETVQNIHQLVTTPIEVTPNAPIANGPIMTFEEMDALFAKKKNHKLYNKLHTTIQSVKKPSWDELFSRLNKMKETMESCKAAPLTFPEPSFGEERLKMVEALKKASTDLYNKKIWLEKQIGATQNNETDKVLDSLGEINENMKQVTKFMSDFTVVQENASLPVEELKNRPSQTPFDEQISEIVEMVESFNKDGTDQE